MGWVGLGWRGGGRDIRMVAELTAVIELVMAAGLMVLITVRGSRRPWLAVVEPPPPHPPRTLSVPTPRASALTPDWAPGPSGVAVAVTGAVASATV